jgi:hypothetical protein
VSQVRILPGPQLFAQLRGYFWRPYGVAARHSFLLGAWFAEAAQRRRPVILVGSRFECCQGHRRNTIFGEHPGALAIQWRCLSPGRRPSRLRVGVFADRPAPPALACGIGTSRLTNSRIGSFSGRLEDHATPNLDGMVGEAFIKPAQERNIDGGCDAMGPVLLPEKSE